MLKILEEFRKKLDNIMVQAIHKRVVLYGYDYTGRFLSWYAKYYHSIEIDYIITLDTSFSRPYDQELFQKTLLDFNYKDVDNAIIWLAEPINEEINKLLKEKGYIKDKTYFDFYQVIYGTDITWALKWKMYLKEENQGKEIFNF